MQMASAEQELWWNYYDMKLEQVARRSDELSIGRLGVKVRIEILDSLA